MQKKTQEEIKLDLNLKKRMLKALDKLAIRDIIYKDDCSFYDSGNLEATLKEFGNFNIVICEELDTKLTSDEQYQIGGYVFRVYQIVDDKEIPTDMYIQEKWQRCGSYFNGYDYKYQKLELVEPYIKIVEVKSWKKI